MATSFFKIFDTEGYVPTCDMNEVIVETDTDDPVNVSLARVDGGNVYLFFTTTLYPFDGVLLLNEIGEIIEEHLLGICASAATFKLEVGEASHSFKAVYCSLAKMTLDPEKSFLKSSPSAFCFADSQICMAAIPNLIGCSMQIHAEVDGDVATISTPSNLGLIASGEWLVSVEDVAAETPNATVKAFTLLNGPRSAQFFILPGQPDLRVAFKNAYNALEYVDLRAIVKEKLEVKADTAVCKGISKQFNRRAEKTYEVEPAIMAESMVETMSQLVASPYICVSVSGEWHMVIITDSTFEQSNDDSELPSIKFTFRFTGRQPFHYLAPMVDHFKAPVNVFTSQFDKRFT